MSVKPQALKKKRANRRKQQVAVVAPPVQEPVIRAAGAKTRKQRRNGGGPSVDGSITIAREEMILSITKANESGSFDLDVSKLPWLKTIAKAYERYTWLSAKIYYKPAVGTNTNGLIVYAVDWNSNPPKDMTRAAIQAHTPVSDHPVWQDTRPRPMVLPTSRLQSRKEYLSGAPEKIDLQPGTFIYNNSAYEPGKSDLIGEIWLSYKIHFFGTVA